MEFDYIWRPGRKKKNKKTLARSKVQTDVYLLHRAITVLVLGCGRVDFIVSAEISGIKGVALAFILLFFPVFTPRAPSPLLLLSSHPDARKYTLRVIPVLTGLRSPMNNTNPISSIHYSRLTGRLADTSGVYIYIYNFFPPPIFRFKRV